MQRTGLRSEEHYGGVQRDGDAHAIETLQAARIEAMTHIG
jgi:hypothetical protein